MVVARHEWGETDREVVAGASVVAMAWWWVPVNEHMGGGRGRPAGQTATRHTEEVAFIRRRRSQGSTFRRKTAGKPENFPFPLVAGKWNSDIFRHFPFSNLKIQKYL